VVHGWVGHLLRQFAVLVWLDWSRAHNDYSLVETVQDGFEVITLNLGFMALWKDGLAVAEDTGDHLERDATIHQVEENDQEPVGRHI